MSALLQQMDLFDLLEPPAPTSAPTCWLAPPVDLDRLAVLEDNGQSPFGSEAPDDESAQGMADETMNGLVWDLHALAALREAFEAGPSAFRSAKAWEAFRTSYPAECARHVDSYEGTLSSVTDLWGDAGREAFDQEARRRVG